MNFSNRLKQCRNKKGWTQESISRRLKIKRSTYAKYETGENQPDQNTLIKLADLFGITTDYLLGRENKNAFDCFDNENRLFLLVSEHLKTLNISIRDFVDIEWHYLNRRDVQDIIRHIEWMAYKAKKRSGK